MRRALRWTGIALLALAGAALYVGLIWGEGAMCGGRHACRPFREGWAGEVQLLGGALLVMGAGALVVSRRGR